MDSPIDAALAPNRIFADLSFELPGRAHVDEPDTTRWLARTLHHHIGRLSEQPQPSLAIVCIGTDRSTGDSLGPIVGSKLSEWQFIQRYARVIGTLDEPVHAGNLREVLTDLEQRGSAIPRVLAIDACLGKMGSVGFITFSKGPLRPGTGVNKELPSIGDLHITGIVNVGGFMEYLVLQNTRLSLVMKMADAIARGILSFLSDPEHRRPTV